jgi:hypothetical protein
MANAVIYNIGSEYFQTLGAPALVATDGFWH